ncbi:MAG: NUDIX domain-containing protein [Bacteroidetes bacterium]|nr:NUDIX domain-containing protein [Bacteroidota bacterium]
MPSVHTRILPRNSIKESNLTYVVIAARECGQWIFVRHRERSSWELPAGHIEPGESPGEAASRELNEETGSIRSTMEYLCDYQVSVKGKTESGRLYGAEILERESNLKYETGEVLLASVLPQSLTYPEVQTLLFEHAKELLRS